MNRNIIDAIGTLIKRKPFYLDDPYSSENPNVSARYWSMEEYVKNLFADSFDAKDMDERSSRRVEVFSHFGNSTNPPDLILRGGDAIEIKNMYIPERIAATFFTYFLESTYDLKYSPLILNTVYPRQKLYADDMMVTNACRKAETWAVKDIIYAIGASRGKQLTHLCMVYGSDYCASARHYENILAEMRVRLKDIPNLHKTWSERYLGRICEVDPTGATYLELRNMWYLENPWSYFRDVYRPNPSAGFNFMCIINDEKFYRLKNGNKLLAWAEICPQLKVELVRIKNPDEPAQKRDALLIRYEV